MLVEAPHVLTASAAPMVTSSEGLAAEHQHLIDHAIWEWNGALRARAWPPWKRRTAFRRFQLSFVDGHVKFIAWRQTIGAQQAAAGNANAIDARHTIRPAGMDDLGRRLKTTQKTCNTSTKKARAVPRIKRRGFFANQTHNLSLFTT
jgi:hypothetical protein